MANSDIGIVLITAPDEQTATIIARGLVERKLAACVNIIPGVRSIFHWQGQIEESSELLLIAKTSRELYPELESAVLELHPYDTPEVILVDLADGLEKYKSWLLGSLVQKSPASVDNLR